jgi:hypothetical protein
MSVGGYTGARVSVSVGLRCVGERSVTAVSPRLEDVLHTWRKVSSDGPALEGPSQMV